MLYISQNKLILTWSSTVYLKFGAISLPSIIEVFKALSRLSYQVGDVGVTWNAFLVVYLDFSLD